MVTKKELEVDPVDLEIKQIEDGFGLTYGGEVLISPHGVPVFHASRPLLEHIRDELDALGPLKLKEGHLVGPRFFSSLELLGMQKSVVEQSEKIDEVLDGLQEALRCEPVFHGLAGPEWVDQLARYGPVKSLLEDRGLKIPRLPDPHPREHFDSEKEYEDNVVASSPSEEHLEAVRDMFNGLSPEQKAVTIYLNTMHGVGLLFPMALAMGRCNPNEYGMGLLAAQALLGTVWSEVTHEEQHNVQSGYKHDAQVAVDFLRLTKLSKIMVLIAGGEDTNIEFKSTLRWDMRENRRNRSLSEPVLKTISAFLNTNGGKLILGVADDGSPVGIEKDQFPNHDKYQLHLMNLIKASMGKNTATLVDISFFPYRDVTVALIECTQCNRPVFLRVSKGEPEEFYVRTGPSSESLGPKELLDYIRDHFPDQKQGVKPFDP